MTILKQADFEVPGFGEFALAPVAVPRYADAVQSLGPLAYWRMGEGSGTTLADQTGAHPLTLAGDVTLGQPGALALDDDAAVRFDDGTASSAGPVLPTAAAAAFTLVFWARRPLPTIHAGPIISQFTSGADGHLRLILRGDATVRYYLAGDPNFVTQAAVGTDWRMLAFTRDADGNARWYVDGQLDTQDAGHGTALASVPLILGASTTNIANILLDELAVFDQPLSADQVRWLHGLGTANLATDPAHGSPA